MEEEKEADHNITGKNTVNADMKMWKLEKSDAEDGVT